MLSATLLAGTTRTQLDLVTSTPLLALKVLKDMEAFLKTGDDGGRGLPILVGSPTTGVPAYWAKKYKKGSDLPLPGDVTAPFSFLAISADTHALWEHALKRSAMSGGFPDRGLPPEYNPVIAEMWPVSVNMDWLFTGFIGHASNQLLGVESHIKKIEAKIGPLPDDKARRRLHVGLGVAAGVLVVGAGLLLATSSDR
jgi:hypothetical protein